MKTTDCKRRDALCGVTVSKYDTACFKDLSVENLETLIAEGFADPEETQNDSPSIDEFLALMKRNPGMTAHGYVVSNKRPDSRVSLEGVSFSGTVTVPMVADFCTSCQNADEFVVTADTLHCWYD